jgi:hypothetical protein
MKWTEEMIEAKIRQIASEFMPARMPTNREVIEITGNHALSVAIQKNGGYEFWAKKLGLEQKYSESRIGLEYERRIAEKLRKAGHVVEETSVKHPYDLLIDGCVKVDVKVANTSKVRGSDVHAYRLSKKHHTCDFYICCENDAFKDIYVIPANMVSGQTQIDMGVHSRKYEHYKDAFYLIDDAAKFYKSLVIPF